jgi:hypothetical protein
MRRFRTLKKGYVRLKVLIDDYVADLRMQNFKVVVYVSEQFHLPYFSIDNAHLMYNAHPKLFRHSFSCIDNAHNSN